MKKNTLALMATLLLSGCYDAENEVKAYKTCLSAGMKAEARHNGEIICIPNEQIRSLEDLKRHILEREYIDRMQGEGE